MTSARPKLCLTRAIHKETGEWKNGIFTWQGRSWRTAAITGLVKELPETMPLKDQQRALNAMRKEMGAS